jgi:hypothetical protein
MVVQKRRQSTGYETHPDVSISGQVTRPLIGKCREFLYLNLTFTPVSEWSG